MTLDFESSVIFLKPTQIIHPGSGGIFLPNEWQQTLQANNIQYSSSDSQTHQKQVYERFNGVFTKLLREKLNKDLSKKKTIKIITFN